MVRCCMLPVMLDQVKKRPNKSSIPKYYCWSNRDHLFKKRGNQLNLVIEFKYLYKDKFFYKILFTNKSN